MPLTPQDELHLARALTLARDAVALASPNPTVGCVIARGDTVLGEGAHLYDRRDHAEIVALKQASPALKGTGFSPSVKPSKVDGALAPEGLRGATAHVTLEPCSHHGRTGPCADALIAAGITRCVIATVDPNPLVRGNGIAKLRAANLDVLVLDPKSTLAQQARRLNDAFAHFIQHHRPFVTLKAALSVDGKLAPPPATRTVTAPHWITGSAARADAQLLRHAHDAVLTGIGTVLADNPALTDRTNLPRRRPLLRVVLDTHLRLPLNAVLATEPPALADAAERPASEPRNQVLVLCSESAPAENEAALRARNIEVVRTPTQDNHLDLHAALAGLAARGTLSVLLEAGSALNAAFLRAGLVDRLVLYYAERELGLDAVPFAQNLASPYELQQQLTQTTRTAFPSDITPNTEDIRITGYLHNPWANI